MIKAFIMLIAGAVMFAAEVAGPDNKRPSRFVTIGSPGNSCKLLVLYSGCLSSWSYELSISGTVVNIVSARGYNSLRDYKGEIIISKEDSDIINCNIQWFRTENGKGASTNHREMTIEWTEGGKIVEVEKYSNDVLDIPYSIPIFLWVDGLIKRQGQSK